MDKIIPITIIFKCKKMLEFHDNQDEILLTKLM